MNLRSGIYIVPVDQWYVERAVWLISGIVLLITTALSLLVDLRFILMLTITGLVSMNVALTGFCPVANVLHRFGMRAKLDSHRSEKWYFMQTDRWYLERRIYLAVGFNMTAASVLTLVHSPWWLLFPGFVGVAMLWFAATGFCIMANGFYWIGAEPRLNPDAAAGRAESPSYMGYDLRRG